MAKWNIAEKNGMWKGGRSVASNGYILIKVDPNHHLADVRGYAYEHRLVAEQKLGRALQPGEQVHHVNGDKADNRPENLEIALNIAHHQYFHRKTESKRRLPDQNNEIILCACGCGQSLQKYDTTNRPRKYVSGHNPVLSPTADLIISALSDGEKSLQYLANLHGNERAVIAACSKLVKHGKIIRVGRGKYGRAN